jgi:high affinity Mn2+ porin
VGLAFAANGLAFIHRRYLELGGQSYLLGDDGLSYGHEKLIEGYYNLPLGHGLYAALDIQQIWNPGYNQNRGPVTIVGLRFHAEGDVQLH